MSGQATQQRDDARRDTVRRGDADSPSARRRRARPAAPTEAEMALSLWRALAGTGGTRHVEAFRAVSMLTQWAEDDARQREQACARVAGTGAGARTDRDVLMRTASAEKARRVVRLLSVLRRHLDPAAVPGTGLLPSGAPVPTNEQPGRDAPQTRPEGRRR